MAMERTYNIPLRREWLRVPKHRRAKRAVKAIRNFLAQHMKSEEVKIGKYLNEAVWARGIRSPPHHVQVNVTKDDEGIVSVELVGAPKAEPKIEEKVKEPVKAPEAKPAAEEKKEEAAVKKDAAKPAEKKETKQEKAKPAKKDDGKAEKKVSSKSTKK